jgi:HlyD family secretion protein
MEKGRSEMNDGLSREAVARTLGVDAQAGPRPRRRRARVLWAIAGLAAAVAVVTGARGSTAAAVQYRTQPASRGDLRVTVTATGTLEPTKTVAVGSEVSGTILEVLADEDDHVKAGQVLARIDPAKLEAQARQLEAALEAAEARLMQTQATREEAQQQLRRLEQVRAASGGKVPSELELNAQQASAKRSVADEASARASVSQARASLQALRTDLGKAVIHSPIDGVILTRTAETGATVAAQFQAPELFKIAEDLRRMELRVDVDEADVAQVREGEDATFTVDAYPARTFQARVQRVRQSSATTDGVVTYEAVLVVDNAGLLLRPGMTATAELTASRVKDALLVPNAALRFTPPVTSAAAPSGSFVRRLLPGPPMRRSAAAPAATNGRTQRVYVLKEGGTPSAVAVEAGLTDGKLTQILSGDVAPGTALVVDTIGKE